MSIASFFKRLFQKEKKQEVSREELLWIELAVPEDIPVLDKKILNALAGRGEPLEAEAALAEFTGYGWARIKKDVYELAVGKKPCLPTYFRRILAAYPAETGKLLGLCFEEMPVAHRLVYLTVLGGDDAAKVSAEVLKLLPSLEPESLGSAFATLSAYPTEAGLAAIASHLEHQNWKIQMKAAAALAEAKAVAYIPAIRAAATAADTVVGAGLLEIATRMEVSEANDLD